MILKISLQPLSNFFFGGESSFNEGDERTRRSTYVLHSNKFPQQTGALGLIRNQLLIQSGLLTDNASRVKDKRRAKVLIGKTGFRLNAQNNFGVIKRISPVFLESTDGEICVPAPLDDVLIPAEGNNKVPMTFALKDATGLLYNYREKEGVYAQFQHPQNGNAKLDDLFISNKRVGITKAARPWGNPVADRDDDSGYYYQTFLGFTPEQPPSAGEHPFYIKGFCFYIELKEQIKNDDIHNDDIPYEWSDEPVQNFVDNKFTLRNAVVEFGGERSTFNMLVEKLEDSNWEIPKVIYKNTSLSDQNQLKVARLVCLSPSYVQHIEKLRSLTYLRVTQTIPFRFLQSAVDTTNHYQKVQRIDGQTSATANAPMTDLLESKLFHLLDRGSVLYFDAVNQAQVEALFKHDDFQIIGYNQYHIL